jgi:hypothetical protein
LPIADAEKQSRNPTSFGLYRFCMAQGACEQIHQGRFTAAFSLVQKARENSESRDCALKAIV